MLGIISPVRPKQLHMVSGLGNLATTLRGGNQPVGQLLNQLSRQPGVKAGALSQAFGHVDPDERMTPSGLGAVARSPKLFAQQGATANQSDDELTQELATDLIYGPEFHEQRKGIVRSILEDNKDKLSIGEQNLLRNRHWTPEQFDDAQSIADKHVDVQEIYMDELATDAYRMASDQMTGTNGKSFGPSYSGYQRQPGLSFDFRRGEGSGDNPEYFETVLRGTPRRGAELNMPNALETNPNYHFVNPSQLGHARGSITPDGRVFAEELQSDPLEHLSNQPSELEGIYGKLGRLLIDRSAEAGAPSVSFPDANRIASVRSGAQLPFFRDVYDKQLRKQLYDPLAKRGVPLRQENGWTTMDLPEGILEAIKNQGLLNYKRGGLAQLK
jgi:hypothetical protein